MVCPSFECFGNLNLPTKMGALFACIFHLVSNCQEGICTQNVAEISVKSFIGEVVNFTYLIAHK